MPAVVGVDIGGTKARLCVQDDEGGEHVETFATGAHVDGAGLAAELGARLARIGVRPHAIGVAVPGLVDAHGRVRVSDVLPALAGWSPADALGAFAPMVATLNDAKAGLVEAAAGEPPGATVALVMVGTGIGAAILAHGHPLVGAAGWAGELGSIPIETQGRVVRLDDAASGAAILRGLGGEAAEVHARLSASDPSAVDGVRRAGHALGLGLATLVNVVNPGKLVIAGGTLRYAGYLDAARDALERWALGPLLATCRVDAPADGDRLVCRGAARHARERVRRIAP